MELAEEIEIKFKAIHLIIDRIEEQRAEEAARANEPSGDAGCAPALENLAKPTKKKPKTANVWLS
ncbi:MAG: hypothetical protein KJO21_05880 [Verrucomicrobiae bacterium]|nr:hypothetical protein [Verrucomicrobiae bacterium]NNJ43705.1 hypothetical protein [Akkermansiaceae bacterium]